VLVLATWPAPVRRGRRWGREAPADAEPATTGVSRATLVDTATVERDEAQAWLAQASEGELAAAEALLNQSIRAHRAAAADPFAHEVRAEQALTARAGYGAGFEVAEGSWSEARTLRAADAGAGSRRARRMAALRPQERLAALLSGRDAVLACEEMALRARADLDAGRTREAAMQAHLAVEAAVAELQAFREQRDLRERVGELEAHRTALAAAANEALQGGVSADAEAAVQAGLERVEAALRARAATAQY
jgi:hypothetical protein